jgi:murein DD-endopeptidase MepM/ murein hydrolase activator NlpD
MQEPSRAGRSASSRVERVKQVNGTTARLGRAACGAIILCFSIGAAAGIVSIGGRPMVDVAVIPGDLMPAAGLPQIDLGVLSIDRDEVDVIPTTLFNAIALDPRPGAAPPKGTSGANLQAGPRLAAIIPGPTGMDSLASGAEHAEEAATEKVLLPRPEADVATVSVQRGDTLMNLLLRAGVDRNEAHQAVTALQTVYDPRHLRAGQALQITSLHGAEMSRLVGFSFDISFDHEVRIDRNPDGSFSGERVERPQRRKLVHRMAQIDDSLYLAADRLAVPRDLTAELIKLFSWDVDFQRDLRAGDSFEALFEEVTLAGGGEAARRGGDLLFAQLILSGRVIDAYRFAHDAGTVEYYDSTGRSLRKFLLRTPIDGGRISSRFGMRRHPVLGYSRMHKGTDFAAPTGTPVYAAGSGRVETAGRKGGYGNYIRIKHSGEYSTAYAHLSRYAKGINPGARVTQGQVIGYVGSTGRSTGPHLHYEVLRYGEQTNSQLLKHPPLAQLAGADLARFREEMVRIDRLRRDLRSGTRVASKNGGASPTIQ